MADLPDNVRDQYKKLKMLAQWPEDIVAQISVDADSDTESLGITRLNELNQLVSVVRRYHPEVAEESSEDDLYSNVVTLYQGGTFRDNCKSDRGIREAKAAIRTIPEDDDVQVRKFLEGKISLNKLKAVGQDP